MLSLFEKHSSDDSPLSKNLCAIHFFHYFVFNKMFVFSSPEHEVL